MVQQCGAAVWCSSVVQPDDGEHTTIIAQGRGREGVDSAEGALPSPLGHLDGTIAKLHGVRSTEYSTTSN